MVLLFTTTLAIFNTTIYPDSSFSESFYGLKRMRVIRNATTQLPEAQSQFLPLNLSDRRKAMFSLVLWPYLKSKMDQHYKNLTDPIRQGFNLGEEASMVNLNVTSQISILLIQSPLSRFIRRVFIRTFPVLDTAWGFLNILYMFAYLFDYTGYFSPLFQLFKQQLRRMSMADFVSFHCFPLWLLTFPQMKQGLRGGSASPRTDSTPPSERTILWWVWSLLSKFAQYFKWMLLVGIFAFKFFEWWYSSEDQIRRREKLPIPPPPRPLHVFYLLKSSH